MSKPKPIDNETLPTFKNDAIVCWRFNLSRATDTHAWSPVERVWATQRCTYFGDPNGDGYVSGSQTVGTLYATEHDAWEACIAAVQEFFCDRIDELRDMADAARKEPTHE